MNKQNRQTQMFDNLFEGVYCVDTKRKITYWNKGAERISGYSAREVVGSSCADNILVHIDRSGKQLCQDGCPLVGAIMDGKDHYDDTIYLHHKKGHRVPISVSVSPIRNSRGRITGAIELFQDLGLHACNEHLSSGLNRLALLDSLTGIPNRRFLEIKLEAAHEEQKRHGISFGVIFLDIDHFKQVNDTYGHRVGDKLLRMVGRTLSANLRAYNTVGRWGGEEFLCILNHTSVQKLLIVAEKLRTLVEHSFIQEKNTLVHVTVTVGAALAHKGESFPSVIERADLAMYAGKKAGRNRVVMSGRPATGRPSF